MKKKRNEVKETKETELYDFQNRACFLLNIIPSTHQKKQQNIARCVNL